VLFTALAYACALFYLAELAEDYPTRTKQCVKWGIIVIILLHVLCWVFESFPTHCILVGLATHVSSFQLLRTFPDCAVLSFPALGTLVLVLLDNLAWWWYFSSSYMFQFWEVMAFFFLFVWLMPVAFFVSLSLGEGVLPVRDVDSGKKQKKSGTLKALFSLCGLKKHKEPEAEPIRGESDGYGADHYSQLSPAGPFLRPSPPDGFYPSLGGPGSVARRKNN